MRSLRWLALSSASSKGSLSYSLLLRCPYSLLTASWSVQSRQRTASTASARSIPCVFQVGGRSSRSPSRYSCAGMTQWAHRRQIDIQQQSKLGKLFVREQCPRNVGADMAQPRLPRDSWHRRLPERTTRKAAEARVVTGPVGLQTLSADRDYITKRDGPDTAPAQRDISCEWPVPGRVRRRVIRA